jgi:hypothetical protein
MRVRSVSHPVDVAETTALVVHELRRAARLLPALEGYVADVLAERPAEKGGGSASGCACFDPVADDNPAPSAGGKRKARKARPQTPALADDLM